MQRVKNTFFLFAVLVSVFPSCIKDNTPPCTNDTIDACAEYSFKDDVSPIIATHCCTCHDVGDDSGIGLCNDTTGVYYEGVKEYSCRVVNAINHKAGVPAMPVPGVPFNKLPEHQIRIITCWVQGGMKNN